jgi:hypothetical protein
MFDILQDLDDGLFCVYYSGTLLEGFDSRADAEDYISMVMAEFGTAYSFQ